MVLLMLIAAPILQIVLSVLRIKQSLSLSLIAIAGIAFITGILLSIWAMNIIMDAIPASPGGFKCGIGAAAVMLGGFFITMVSVPVIGLASYLFYRTSK
jgi:branched-subunit amino acid ABC-type transport system permease component